MPNYERYQDAVVVASIAGAVFIFDACSYSTEWMCNRAGEVTRNRFFVENWCWQPEVLARLSKHHESGDALPKELLETMIAAKSVHESVFMMRQICTL